MADEKKIFAQEIHHRVVRKFEKRKVVVYRADEIWAMDLAAMDSLVTYNNGYKFILCIVDVFTKYAWCVPLKNKSAPTVLDAVKGVVEKSGIPKRYGLIKVLSFIINILRLGLKVKTLSSTLLMASRNQ